jgi:hypothetical protein
MKNRNCCINKKLTFESKQDIVVCSNCGKVHEEQSFIHSKKGTFVEYSRKFSLTEIMSKIHNIMNICLELLDIDSNKIKIIKRKMIFILKTNKLLIKSKNIDSVIFVLFMYALKELKIDINKTLIVNKIKKASIISNFNNLKI